MARSPLDNEYRRINDRMQKLWETYGADNPTYQNYASQVQANFNINILPDGRVQIKQGKSNANINLYQRRTLNDMLKMDTKGSLRAEAKKYAKEHGLGKSANIDELVEKTFEGSLPSFIAAFTKHKKLSAEEVQEIRKMIDAYEEK